MVRDLATQMDRLLRGHFTRPEDLREGRIEVPVRTLVTLGLVLGAIYGIFMGLYAVMRPGNASIVQPLATMVKVPLLFLLTLAVTFPSLYVFSALANSRLKPFDTLRLLLVAVGVNLALLASFGPVTGFFTLSTDSYPFMIVLNVIFFAAGGIVGLAFLRRALEPLFELPPLPHVPVADEESKTPEEEEPEEEEPEEKGPEFVVIEEKAPPTPGAGRREAEAGDRRQQLPKRIFLTWTVIYGVVGAQMGWILRPFIGTPGMPFSFFRERESSFFEGFFRALGRLLS